jgi:glyoxylase-like metal-dependent hydrolase (beta-lactamase superfamily II)/8-oxo-dGTP pyrophosphatase MutT (NUDIX family)
VQPAAAGPGERIRPSATVILHRNAPELEVYLVERSLTTRFFPGYHAFPGGVAEPGEPRAQAALRELYEETGVVVKDPAALRQAATLLTPPFGPTRYDTTFFTCPLPEGAEPRVDGVELRSGAWIAPGEALRRWEREAWPLPPPTLAFLRALDATRDPARVAEETRALDGRPHHERFRIEIHPGVNVLPLRAPTLPPATTQNCYLFDADPVLVVDPGSPRPEEWVALVHTLRELAPDGRDVVVVLTHHHPDHVGALPEIRARFPRARVVAHRATQDALPKRWVDEAIDDGHAFDLGRWHGRPWRVRALHTPGHTAGHVALRDERWGAVLAGDLVSGVSTILIDPGEGDMGAYLASLRRLADLRPPLVLPGHGPALPGAAFAAALEHRSLREAKALAALGAQPRSVEAMLPQVYDDTPPEAWPLAARSLESILLHLERQGKARRAGDGWASRGDGGAS